jgi:hypothetical protein
MLPRVKRAVLATAALTLLVAGCDHDDKKSAEGPKTTTGAAEPAAQPAPKGPPPLSQRFRTRPDLKPPVTKIDTPARGTAPGYVFLAPKMVVTQAGPMIMDNRGDMVWFKPLTKTKGITDFRVQQYRGRPVLTWWRGRVSMEGIGESGWFVIYDDSYRAVAEVRAGNNLVGDIHEFLITPRDTALFLVYHRIPQDLTRIGGPKQGKVWDGIVQEVDIPTGRVLFEWHSYPQVGVEESYAKVPDPKKGAKADAYDYFHANSIDIDTDGNFLVSARNTHAVYKIDRRTKKVLWRLGGKKSDFKMGPGTKFAWQHDARRQPDGTITLFDNSAAPPVAKFSRVLRLQVDTNGKTATLIRSYTHPKRLLIPFEANAQFLPNGNVFVGWGAAPYVSEFDANGRIIFDAHFGRGKAKITGAFQDADTYRAYRFVWHGHPLDRPAVVAAEGQGGRVTVYVSWNGATEVARWRVLAGPDGQRLLPVRTVVKTGFETAIPVQTDHRFFAVQALDASGRLLRTSRPVAARS